MLTFETAAQVRRFLKDRGFGPDIESIHREPSPFSSRVYFCVRIRTPEGVSLVTSSGPEGTKTYTSDEGETASRVNRIRAICDAEAVNVLVR